MKTTLISVCVLWLLAAGHSWSAPVSISHQGRLLDSSGNPLSGSFDITFRLFDVAIGGGVLWEESNVVPVDDGLFTVILGNTTPLDFASLGIRPDSLWLEIQIGGDSPLVPRSRITPTPMAAEALSVRGDFFSAPGQGFFFNEDGDTIVTMGRKGNGGVKIAVKTRMLASPADTGLISQDIDSSSLQLFQQLFDHQTALKIDEAGAGMYMYDMATDDTLVAINGRDGKGNIKMAIKTKMLASPPDTGLIVMTVDSTSLSLSQQLYGYTTGLGINESGGNLILTDSAGDTTIAITGRGTVATGKIETGRIRQAGLSSVNQSGQCVVLDVSETMDDGVIGLFGAVSQPGQPSYGNITFGHISNGGLDTSYTFNLVTAPDSSWIVMSQQSGSVYDQAAVRPSRLDLSRTGGGGTTGGIGAGIPADGAGFQIDLTNPLGDTTVVIRDNGTVSLGTNEQLATLTVSGDICATGAIGACSDERYKQRVSPISNALEKVLLLDGVEYEWNRDKFASLSFEAGRQLGVVAQEVRQVVPEVVSESPAGMLAVDYGKLTPLLIEAIKDLKNENEDLRRRIEALESK